MEREVEAIGVAESGDVRGGGAFAEHLDDGVSGDEMDEEEDDGDDDPEDREGDEDAADGRPGGAEGHAVMSELSSWSRSVSASAAGRERFLDVDAGDAVAGHLGYGVAAAFVFEAFADGGDVAQLGEEKAGDGLDACFAGEVPVELGVEVAEGGVAVERHDCRRR